MSGEQDFGRGWSEYSDRRAGPSDWQPPVGWLQRGNQHRPGDIVRHRSTNDIGTVNHVDPDNPEIVHVDWHHDSPGASVFAHGGAYSSDHHWSALEPIESANPMQLSELDHAYLDQISQGDPIGGNDHWIIRSPNKEARTAAVWDWKLYTPALVQQLKDNNLWGGEGDQGSWVARSQAGDHYTIRPAGSVVNTLPKDHPLKRDGDPQHWEVEHHPPEYGHDPEGYFGDIYGPTALNKHAEPVEGTHPHGFSSPQEAMDWVASRHPEEGFDPDDTQDPFDPRLIGASRRRELIARLDYADIVRLAGDGMSWEDTMRHIDEVLAAGEPEDKSDYSTDYYHNPDDDEVSDDDEHERMDHYHDKWFDQLPDSHKRWVRETNDEAMLFDFQRYYDHHANEGAPYTLTPLPEHEKMRQQRGYMKRMRQLEPYLDQYRNPEGGGHTARQAGLDMADLIRLAGDGMSWEDTMAHIDRVLAEGEGHKLPGLSKAEPGQLEEECDECGAVIPVDEELINSRHGDHCSLNPSNSY